MKGLSISTALAALFVLAMASNACTEDEFVKLRRAMVQRDIKARGIKSERVLYAMGKVERQKFVPDSMARLAYEDHPLPIGEGQTISQPYIVALMTEAVNPKPEDRVLEIGTGSGYQAAVLAEIVKEVYTIEIIPELSRSAEARLKSLGYENIKVKTGDGFFGWPDAAPFDAIIVTASTEKIPEHLINQLKTGGSMVLPLGPDDSLQHLTLVKKTEKGLELFVLEGVLFVPMTGEVRKRAR